MKYAGKLGQAGAATPHGSCSLEGENCLDSIDQVPVNTGVLAGHTRPFEVCQRILSLIDMMIQDI